MSDAPSPNRDSGRGVGGKFSKGNSFGQGNPYAKQVAELRAAILEALTTERIRNVVHKLLELAEAGNMAAIRETFDRAIGKPLEADIIARIEAIEAALAARETNKN